MKIVSNIMVTINGKHFAKKDLMAKGILYVKTVMQKITENIVTQVAY